MKGVSTIYGINPIREAIRAQKGIATIFIARASGGATRQLLSEAPAEVWQGFRFLECRVPEDFQRAGNFHLNDGGRISRSAAPSAAVSDGGRISRSA